jgi:hypothetical protein
VVRAAPIYRGRPQKQLRRSHISCKPQLHSYSKIFLKGDVKAASGQKANYSLGANVFCVASSNGHRTTADAGEPLLGGERSACEPFPRDFGGVKGPLWMIDQRLRKGEHDSLVNRDEAAPIRPESF